MKKPPILDSILKEKGALIELVIGAVILGLGVNLLATAISTLFNNNLSILFLSSATLIFASIALIARRIFSAFTNHQVFEGYFCLKDDTNEIVDVAEYEYANKLTRDITSLFSENAAYKKIWEKDPISRNFERDKLTGAYKRVISGSSQLLIEATEYFVLEKLSTHLSTYFNNEGINKKYLQKFTREDVPSLVFKNRFLDTFSRPMQERPAFIDSHLGDGKSRGEIITSYGPGGVQFKKFTLTLPAGAKVNRTSSSSIEISTPRFNLTLEIDFPGYNTNLPNHFESLYLEESEFLNTSTYKVEISATVSFKAFSLLSRRGWQYHSWIDSFLSSLEDDFSKDSFLKKIDWDRVIATTRAIRRSMLPKNSRLFATQHERVPASPTLKD